MNNLESIQKRLFAMQDLEYKKFHCKLIPTISSDTVIGVRTPELKNFSKELWKSNDYQLFITTLPHTYYEENNLHGLLIAQGKDFDKTISLLHEFLPYIDNWATCDLLIPTVFKKNKVALLSHITNYLASDHTYTIRFVIKMLMSLYLDADFSSEYPP